METRPFRSTDRALRPQGNWLAQEWYIERDQQQADREHLQLKDGKKPEEAADDQQYSGRQAQPAQPRYSQKMDELGQIRRAESLNAIEFPRSASQLIR
jgi:hypothetical protein